MIKTRDPFDTIREAIESLRHERETRSPIAPTGDVSAVLAALDELREQLRQADEALVRERLEMHEERQRAVRAEQENRQLRERMQPALDALLATDDQGDWFYDGRDIFTEGHGDGGHRLIVPLPETWHESQRVPDSVVALIVASVNAMRALAAAEEPR